MDILECTDGVNRKLCDFYGRKYFESQQISLWFEKLGWLETRDFQAAIDEITTCEKAFPTPQVILKYADEAKRRRQGKELQQDKTQAQNFFKPEKHRPGIARDCVEFHEAVVSFPRGSIEKLEFEVDGYKVLMKKYPDAGFEPNYREALAKLQERRPIQAAKIY